MGIERICLVYFLNFVTHSVHSFMYLTMAVRYNARYPIFMLLVFIWFITLLHLVPCLVPQ